MDRDGSKNVCLSSSSLSDYFVECIDEAISRQGLQIDEHVRAYVVNLLTSFTEREALLTEDLEDLLAQPIAIQMLKAMQANPRRRFRLLKQVGDFSLYLVGFFSQSFDRSLVDSNYYCDMGAGAYKRAADTLTAGGLDNPFRQLYSRLAVRFREIVDLLNDVSERCFGRDDDVLRLYDRFLATGSDRLAARLARLGVVVGPTPGYVQ